MKKKNIHLIKRIKSWRWFGSYRVVTLENASPANSNPAFVSPMDMYGINGYEAGLERTEFSWRWIPRHHDGQTQNFRVVTIEDQEKAPKRMYKPKVLPINFIGVHGYSDEITHLKFCWRSMKNSSGVSYRCLTIE